MSGFGTAFDDIDLSEFTATITVIVLAVFDGASYTAVASIGHNYPPDVLFRCCDNLIFAKSKNNILIKLLFGIEYVIIDTEEMLWLNGWIVFLHRLIIF